MAIFAVLPDQPDSQALQAAIERTVQSGNYIRLPGGQYLVAYDGTSRALSDLIGISEGTTTAGVVVGVTSYWGRASRDVWEWMSSKSA